MASSRKRPSGRTLAVGLSGGIDSTVLLHMLSSRSGKENFSLEAVHVHHGLSANADSWAGFCRALCKRLNVPLAVRKVSVRRAGKGLEAAARDARYRALRKTDAEVIALAHNLDDQAETVLMNLLRGAGGRGASGMAEHSRLGRKVLWRPLLGTSRKAILAYARRHQLEWIDDESNADEALTRNFIRRSVGPLLEQKFPQWKRSLARAAKHFAKKEAGKEELLRGFLRSRGLKSPSEARLAEMLKQLDAASPGTRMVHDGKAVRLYRGTLFLEDERGRPTFRSVPWNGEPKLALPALGGELRFRKARGAGIAFDSSRKNLFAVRLRQGGERLQPDARRPRRTLKNLFQEAAVPSWQRERLPMLYCGKDLVWVPGLGIDVRYQASGARNGLIPAWKIVS